MLDVTFFSDEALFHLTNYVNTQNTHIWSAENTYIAHETPLHPVKIGVWCAVSRRGIVWSIFFENPINSERYNDTVHEFLGQLNGEEIAEAWFQQDSATCHTARATMLQLSLLFGDRIISKGLWPPRSL
jgi:hypothetical protein